MPFTANCDIYAAVDEVGLNLIALHIMKQRPSLFNYASPGIVANPALACGPVQRTADVDKYNPQKLFTAVPPLPVLGADTPPVGLDFAAQLRGAKLDFYPGNVIPLPAGLNPPLPDQHFSAVVKICAGVDCPGAKFTGNLPAGSLVGPPSIADFPKAQVVPTPTKLECFCFEGFLVGHLTVVPNGNENLLCGIVDAIEIVGIGPQALEDNIACYLKTTLAVLLREKLTIPIDVIAFGMPVYLETNLINVSISLAPNPPVPNNPAVEDDQLKVFINLEVSA